MKSKKISQIMKWREKLLAGKGNKYYPKELLGNLLNWNVDRYKLKKKKK